ncbi:MAG: endolytic transglycosylase MltG, partial [Bacteroidia bacterium]|nr:endolytic transglycosylase MltG [Bacteroidia bacterium]
MYWTASVDEIFQKMKAVNDAFWTEENLQKARKQGLTREEVSILASIVQGETNYEPEMPNVAGVYLNRLHIGMRLQADPTVAFCFNYEPTRILN